MDGSMDRENVRMNKYQLEKLLNYSFNSFIHSFIYLIIYLFIYEFLATLRNQVTLGDLS